MPPTRMRVLGASALLIMTYRALILNADKLTIHSASFPTWREAANWLNKTTAEERRWSQIEIHSLFAKRIFEHLREVVASV